MSLTQKQRVQVADRIRDELVLYRQGKAKAVNVALEYVRERLQQLDTACRRMELCSPRGLTATAAKIRRRLQFLCRDIPTYCQQAETAIIGADTAPPSMRDVYLDLQQVEEEFGELEYKPNSAVLSVVTDPIELEGIQLGEFEVCLRLPSLRSLDSDGPYRVVALTPNPASSNIDVTHPHVQDERMCAGDATVSIRQALANGRICDFFLLVRSVLQTYNPSSPFIALDKWNGLNCHDCGYLIPQEEEHYCEGCGYDFCYECASFCRSCDTTFCRNCLVTCRVCNEDFCPSCMTTCHNCGEALCKTCDDENECPCFEESNDDPEEHEHTQASAPAEVGAV